MKQSIISMNMDCKRKVNVDIICGFRGTGKTTLIKKLAEEFWAGERVVFLQNEFGIENLSQMSLRTSWYVKDIQTGCICCSGIQLLTQTFYETIEEFRPDRIVLEAAETARIESLRTLLSQETKGMYVLEHILYVCNADNFSKKMLISGQFFSNELKQAPVIFLSHIENMTREKRLIILKTIRGINADSPIIETDWKHIGIEELQNAYESGRSIPLYEGKNIPVFADFIYNE